MPSFMGGIHPNYNKLTRKQNIETAQTPSTLTIPLSQHIGAPSEPIVKVGDKVAAGQKIAEAKGPVSVPIHSPISGTVKEITEKPHPVQLKCNAIVIESDNSDQPDPSIKKRENISSLSSDELKSIIKEAGIVGLGGAAFPTHVKLSPPKEKNIDTVILNGAECEPYLTCDHRMMLEYPEEILKGFLIIKKILHAKSAIIGIEDNKKDAYALFDSKIKELNQEIKLQLLPTKYPEGAEKMLIFALTKRTVPAGGLPMDVGCLVSNVQTCKAIYDAVYEGKPLTERVVTVTGAVETPKNLLVKIGTSYSDLIEQCGGAKGTVGKIISGGPMMGIAQSTDEVPVIKGTSGILVQLKEEVNINDAHDCIRCSRCIDVCPMNLMPTQIARYAEYGMIERANEYYAMDCFECGCCSYVCPSKIPLVHWIKYAKAEIAKKAKAKK